jgi:asparagine synthase (glutamine-hydrolysing)
VCGICGIFNPDGLSGEAARHVRQMAAAIIHRGPDDEGFLEDLRAVLGVRRLSIVDIAGGHQPIASENGRVHVAYNGEIYNFLELRKELEGRGHIFSTSSDTEVVVHAYEEEGPAALARLNGIFALALWDSERRRLLLARDPLGVKPLYYCLSGKTVAFASEIKALLTLPWISRQVDQEALHLYLSFRFVPSPWTLFQGIRKLSPGEYLLFEPDRAPARVSYSPAPRDVQATLREPDLLDAFRAHLREAVRRQLMGDVPVGVLLSGGMDSASILALAAEHSSHPVRAYTVGFEDDPDLDEVDDARITARHFGAAFESMKISTRAYRERFAASAYSLDEPLATPSVVPFDALCRIAGRGNKVVLSGQGADEPFGGYLRHRGERLASSPLGRFLAGPARLASAMRPSSEPLERASRTLRVADPVLRFVETLALFPSSEVRRLLLSPSEGPAPEEALRPTARQAENLDPLAQFLYLDARFGLSDDLLLYTDKISMASSLEVRVPFLDLELLRFVESIPANVRVQVMRPKSFLKRALAPLVPDVVLRRKKQNFAPPESAWLTSSEQGPNPRWLLEPESAARRYLQISEMERLLKEHESGLRDRRRQLFALLAFEVWHRTFIEPALSSRPAGSPVPREAGDSTAPVQPVAVPGAAPASRESRPIQVTHFGPGPSGPGGMSSVLRDYSDLRLEEAEFRFVTTFHPDYFLHSIAPFLRAAWRIATSSRRRMDIAHFHLSKGGSFVREGLLVLLARARRFPIIVSIHSGAFMEFQEEHPAMVRRILTRADHVLVLSRTVQEQVRRLTGSDAVSVLPNIVVPAPVGLAPGACRPGVLFAGDVCAEKGVDVLLDSWERITGRMPGAELVIAGPQRGLAPRPVRGVTWLGPVPRRRVLELLAQSRVAVLPSRSEGMPLFALEAMAAGRPLVATNVGTLPELILDSGTLVPVGDARALAEALLLYLRNPHEANRAGAAGRIRVQAEFGPERATEVLLSIYSRLAPKDRPGTREVPEPAGIPARSRAGEGRDA